MFDTNFLKLGDSSYNVSLPALGKQTFDVNVLRFANEKLDNIHWTIKKSVDSDLAEGVYGLVLKLPLGGRGCSRTDSAVNRIPADFLDKRCL
ncbi:hypothetical protein HF325_000468 [Metschnikowia pulcherrima]|uniref:Uncharacterized protein n=1 Tax=Metschnikowia pulcherrima TaxID=27326 RepID=A0A8H7GYN9_9ASCO|nr:hypothetical protein HF325_000468 [Metschnikowia pulcherrima]